MKYTYDKEADALYIRFNRKRYAYGEDLDRERRVDYAKDGTLIGVELLSVSSGVDLRDLPRRQEIEQVLKGLRIKALA
jgi:uncharacterized protein YuzE